MKIIPRSVLVVKLYILFFFLNMVWTKKKLRNNFTRGTHGCGYKFIGVVKFFKKEKTANINALAIYDGYCLLYFPQGRERDFYISVEVIYTQ